MRVEGVLSSLRKIACLNVHAKIVVQPSGKQLFPLVVEP